MKIVIAGNYHQYKRYLRETGQNPRDAKYAWLPKHISGVRDAEVVYYGEYWLNPLLDDPYLKIIQTFSEPNIAYCSCTLGDEPTTTLPGNRCGICNKPRR